LASACPKMDSDAPTDLAREIYYRLAHLCWVIQSQNADGNRTFDSTPTSAELEQIGALEEVVHLNRIMSMGQLAVALAHELAQPLAAIRANAQAAERLASLPAPDIGEIRAALADISADDQRAQTVVQNMRAVFQKRQIHLQTLDLNKVASDVARLVRHDAELRGVRIRILLSSESVLVRGDHGILQQIVLNLVNNGMDAMSRLPAHRRVLSVTTRVDSDSDCGSIVVEDCGSGVPRQDRPKLFTPFFTTKSKGLGIGLSICRTLVEFLQGHIFLEDKPGPGSAFTIEFPLAVREAISRAA
jgi:signal transduction histidine kinase